MKKTYKYEEIFSDIADDPENVLMTIPPDVCEMVGLKPGDTVKVTVEDGKLTLSKSAHIYESPDKGKTVYVREFGAPPSSRKLLNPEQFENEYDNELKY
jgi:bifunctional DNA-binding transcriptional regulator/antitoxin component of YhaV-PrlF toxin-antitoxin module